MGKGRDVSGRRVEVIAKGAGELENEDTKCGLLLFFSCEHLKTEITP